MKSIISYVAVLFLLCCSVAAFAATPLTLTYQGYLKDTGGIPVTTEVTIIFNLYAQESEKNAFWTEKQTLTPTNGIYSVTLGNDPTNPLVPASITGPVYLGIAVDPELEMLPRQALTGSPFAIRAAVAESVPDGAISDSKITGPISSAKIPDIAAMQGTIALLIDRIASLQTTISQQQTLIQNLTTGYNTPPRADAGTDVSTWIGSQVVLYGKAIDPDSNQTISYTWSILSKPMGSSTPLVSPATAMASFTPDVAGSYVIRLTVSDGIASASDTMTIRCVTAMTGYSQLIESENSCSADNPKIAVNGSGSAVVVWEQSDCTRTNIWANTFSPTSGWGTATLIEQDNMGSATGPQVVIDDNGTAMAIWLQSDGTRNNVWANRFTPTGGWGIAQTIESSNLETTSPQIAISSGGNAIAIWKQASLTATLNIWANSYSPAEGWGTAQLIETDDTGDATAPQIAIDAAGRGVAVWQQSDGILNNIWKNEYSPVSGWNTAQIIDTNETANAVNPQIAMNPAGQTMIIWSQDDGTFFRIWHRRHNTATGIWGIPQPAGPDNANQYGQKILINASGNGIIIWQTSVSDYWSLNFTDSTLGTAQQIGGMMRDPVFAINQSGNAVAVWPQLLGDKTTYSLQFNRNTAGTWGTPGTIQITGTAGNISSSPSVGIDPNGVATTVWVQWDGTRYNIIANRMN